MRHCLSPLYFPFSLVRARTTVYSINEDFGVGGKKLVAYCGLCARQLLNSVPSCHDDRRTLNVELGCTVRSCSCSHLTSFTVPIDQASDSTSPNPQNTPFIHVPRGSLLLNIVVSDMLSHCQQRRLPIFTTASLRCTGEPTSLWRKL